MPPTKQGMANAVMGSLWVINIVLQQSWVPHSSTEQMLNANLVLPVSKTWKKRQELE